MTTLAVPREGCACDFGLIAIQDRSSCTAQGYLIEAIDQRTLEAFLEGQDHRIRFGFASEAGHLCGQAINLRISDVESHGVSVYRQA